MSNPLKSTDIKFTEINNRLDNSDEKFNELSARSESNFNESKQSIEKTKMWKTDTGKCSENENNEVTRQYK